MPRGNDEPLCEHGKALDVHCCNCHPGFLFNPESCVCISKELVSRSKVITRKQP